MTNYYILYRIGNKVEQVTEAQYNAALKAMEVDIYGHYAMVVKESDHMELELEPIA